MDLIAVHSYHMDHNWRFLQLVNDLSEQHSACKTGEVEAPGTGYAKLCVGKHSTTYVNSFEKL